MDSTGVWLIVLGIFCMLLGCGLIYSLLNVLTTRIVVKANEKKIEELVVIQNDLYQKLMSGISDTHSASSLEGRNSTSAITTHLNKKSSDGDDLVAVFQRLSQMEEEIKKHDSKLEGVSRSTADFLEQQKQVAPVQEDRNNMSSSSFTAHHGSGQWTSSPVLLQTEGSKKHYSEILAQISSTGNVMDAYSPTRLRSTTMIRNQEEGTSTTTASPIRSSMLQPSLLIQSSQNIISNGSASSRFSSVPSSVVAYQLCASLPSKVASSYQKKKLEFSPFSMSSPAAGSRSDGELLLVAEGQQPEVIKMSHITKLQLCIEIPPYDEKEVLTMILWKTAVSSSGNFSPAAQGLKKIQMNPNKVTLYIPISPLADQWATFLNENFPQKMSLGGEASSLL